MDILLGFRELAEQPLLIAFAFFGAVLGILIGATPGLTTAAGIALLIPVTYAMDPLAALILIYVIGKAGRYSGSIPAILFNTPGTTSAAAATLDGYPLAQAGKSGKALKVAVIAAASGDLLGDIVLIFGVVYIAKVAATFGPPEFFTAYLMAFLIIGTVASGSILKTMLSAFLGVLLGLIGTDPISATPRYDFGVLELQSGLHLVPVLIGLFVLSEVLEQAACVSKKQFAISDRPVSVASDQRLHWFEFRALIPVILRSSLIGGVIGALPGLGAAIAVFAAYGRERSVAVDKEKWGTGVLAGVAAPEAAANAVSGPSMIPTLALGIPGSTVSAMMLGVFLLHGIHVGPQIFVFDRDLVFCLFAAGLLGILFYASIGYFFAPRLGAAIQYIPTTVLYPYIGILAFISAYSERFSLFDVTVTGVFGIIGYLMKKHGFNTPAMLITFILTGGAEEALRQSMLISRNGVLVFVSSPFSFICILISATILIRAVYRSVIEHQVSARRVRTLG